MQVIVLKYPKGKSKSTGASGCCCSTACLRNDVLINKLYYFNLLHWYGSFSRESLWKNRILAGRVKIAKWYCRTLFPHSEIRIITSSFSWKKCKTFCTFLSLPQPVMFCRVLFSAKPNTVKSQFIQIYYFCYHGETVCDFCKGLGSKFSRKQVRAEAKERWSLGQICGSCEPVWAAKAGWVSCGPQECWQYLLV